jgi:hypothetical protein
MDDKKKADENRRTFRMPQPQWDALGELAYRRGRGVSISDVLRDAAERELTEAGLWPPDVQADGPAPYAEGHRAPAETVKRPAGGQS